MKRVELAGIAVEATTGAPVVMLQELDAPHRLLPIFIGGPEALSIASTVNGEAPDRPLTHDLMVALLESLDAQVDAAEVTELRDGAFIAQLTVRGAEGEHHLDTRPSDAIALAVRCGAPLLVSEAVLDEAGTVPGEMFDPTGLDQPPLDEAVIDDVVDEFRSFLDDVDPAGFADERLALPPADDEPAHYDGGTHGDPAPDDSATDGD
ncbi:MAG: bifunctional nuclease family protein [Actinomycetia bacterium]|nr:bifunctional nuclease family protein [Actinomycetes bacterium]